MTEIFLEVKYTEYQKSDTLPEADNQLIIKARESAQNAYAPYSGFRVGAAVLLGNGAIITGNNQENAAYPSGLCAERVALFYAASQYPGVRVAAIAVSLYNPGSSDIAKPCGACRQVIAEYEDLANNPIRIILDGNDRAIILNGIDQLLPFRFKKEDLSK